MFNIFKNPKKPIIKKITTCKKHGVVPNYPIIVEDKEYYACWHCLGEFASKFTSVEVVKESGEK